MNRKITLYFFVRYLFGDLILFGLLLLVFSKLLVWSFSTVDIVLSFIYINNINFLQFLV